MASSSSIPATMKAVQIQSTGGVDVMEYKTDVPVPTLAAGQVLVRNEHAGVNYIDTYYRTGLYKAPSFPYTLGREAAGQVVAAHESVTAVKPGQRVAHMGEVRAYAQYSAVAANRLVVLPDGISTRVAAAAYLQGLTAWCLVRESANVQPGQWALVHAAAGGVGLLMVQILRSIGAKVIGTAGSEEKRALAQKNGAEWVLDSRDSLVDKVKEITGGHGVDAIFDGVGKATFDADLEMIAMRGHLVSFGNASGAVEPVNILRLAPKNVSLLRPLVFGYTDTQEDLVRNAEALFDLIKSKKLDILVSQDFPLSEVAAAHTALESRKTTGKLIIDID